MVEDTLVRDIPKDYAPSGVESDDDKSTQRAVLQNSCSTVDILLGKLIQFYVLLAR